MKDREAVSDHPCQEIPMAVLPLHHAQGIERRGQQEREDDDELAYLFGTEIREHLDSTSAT